MTSLLLARDFMFRPETVSEQRHTIPKGAELNQKGKDLLNMLTDLHPHTPVCCSGYMTHSTVVKADKAVNKSTTPLDPEDVCVVGIHWKEPVGLQKYGHSSRDWRTSPVLLFFQHDGCDYAYTCSKSLYLLGERLTEEKLCEKFPTINDFL